MFSPIIRGNNKNVMITQHAKCNACECQSIIPPGAKTFIIIFPAYSRSSPVTRLQGLWRIEMFDVTLGMVVILGLIFF